MIVKAALEALKKADTLKAIVISQNTTDNNYDLLVSSERWSNQQLLIRQLYQVLIFDLDFGLDKKVEQDLWQLGFKTYISALQSLTKDKNKPQTSRDAQLLLTWFLDSASGFYLTLLQEICETYQLDLPIYLRDFTAGIINIQKSLEYLDEVPEPQTSSCIYICQYCLVHLGDIARYAARRKQAVNYYRHAINLSAHSGQPYNQLALLEGAQRGGGDKLSIIFYYVKSVCVAHPFPPATANLIKTLQQAVIETLKFDKDKRIVKINYVTVKEYTDLFLRLIGLLLNANKPADAPDLIECKQIVEFLIKSYAILLAKNSFTSNKLIQILTINLYCLNNCDDKNKQNLIYDLISGQLMVSMLPKVYNLRFSTKLLEYPALPTIKLTFEWIKINGNVLSLDEFSKRLDQITNDFSLLLNQLQQFDIFSERKNVKQPLYEDNELNGFLILEKTFNKYDFQMKKYSLILQNNNETDNNNDITSLKLRAQRLIHLGIWLSTFELKQKSILKKPMKNKKLIKFKINTDDKHIKIFETCNQLTPSLSLSLQSIVDELASIENIDETIENLAEQSLQNLNVNEDKQISTNRSSGGGGGILKPQGSLEKARIEREKKGGDVQEESCFPLPKDILTVNKKRQNVAMQAILRKNEERAKQVKFQTSDETTNEKKPKNVEMKQQLTTSLFDNNQEKINFNKPKMFDDDLKNDISFPIFQPKNNIDINWKHEDQINSIQSASQQKGNGGHIITSFTPSTITQNNLPTFYYNQNFAQTDQNQFMNNYFKNTQFAQQSNNYYQDKDLFNFTTNYQPNQQVNDLQKTQNNYLKQNYHQQSPPNNYHPNYQNRLQLSNSNQQNNINYQQQNTINNQPKLINYQQSLQQLANNQQCSMNNSQQNLLNYQQLNNYQPQSTHFQQNDMTCEPPMPPAGWWPSANNQSFATKSKAIDIHFGSNEYNRKNTFLEDYQNNETSSITNDNNLLSSPPSYSLFSNSNWAPNFNAQVKTNLFSSNAATATGQTQSALERLLQQQKVIRSNSLLINNSLNND